MPTTGGGMPVPAPALSIVTTLYRSLAYLPDFLDQCVSALARLGIADYELVFVDDGSPDDSAAWVRQQCRARPRIRLIELSRNFGHHHAALAGLAHARGAHVFLIDCDLEVPPAFLEDLWAKMQASGADVVYGYQETRKGGWVERRGGQAFWAAFNRLSDTMVPPSVVTERLMARRYVDALLALGDRNVFLAGMMYWAGFVQLGIPVEKRHRHGPSSYTLAKRVALLAHAVTSFSAKPLYASLWVGAFALLVSLANASYVVVHKLLDPASTMMGFPTIVALLTAFFGIMMLGLGVIGVYVAKIFVQGQQRPLFIVRNIEQSGCDDHVD
ncbi:glycosyltransferase family 2 protein [Frateuria hangzhouensis]|uniref:glycosyltransferase family 2 protein n=1 Tax=Frateuria hangzhouensis TaxID=2995589 RepID=UPI002260E351|nr:glycosyltransferase family 2 protein [Frateuria sp. STR12]MCX7514574.1 glycosyltransferase family 2 protein [Frateuria sp. STR12]